MYLISKIQILTRHYYLTFVVIMLIQSLSFWQRSDASFKLRVELKERLKNKDRLSRTIRPVRNETAINITMDMTLSYVLDMDEKHQVLTTNVWLRQEWKNEMMVWNPDEWGGIKNMSMDTSEIWLPDTVLFNNVFEEFDGRLDNVKTLVLVDHTGLTLWSAPFVFRTLCKIKVQNFPFDQQRCLIRFGSWRYPEHQINYLFKKENANLDDTRIKNGEWDVDKVEVTRELVKYPCCPNDIFPAINFAISIRRRSLFYMFHMTIPNFLIALLAFFSFFIPVECGERISFVITVLLSMFVFLLLVADIIPPTSEAVPAIGIYFTSSIILVALALVATGVVLKINYMYLHFPGTRISPNLRRFLFGTLGPYLGFKESKFFYVKDNIDLSHKKGSIKNSDKATSCLFSKKEVIFQNSHENEKGLCNQEIDKAYNDDNCSVTFITGENADQRGSIQDIMVIDNVVSTHEAKIDKSDECRYAAAILDRFFLILFLFVFILSTIIILGIPYLSN